MPFLIIAIYSTLLSDLNYLIPFQKIFSYAIVCFSVGSFWFYTHSRGRTIEALTLIISVFTFFMIWGILNMIIENTDYMKFDGRFNGIQRNPNGVGIFSAMMITLIYVSNKTYQFIRPSKMWLLILVFLIAILLSGSRNGLVTVVIFFSFISLKLNFWKSLIVGSIILGSYDFIFSNIMTLISSFNLNDELRLQTLENASGRIYIWQAAWLEIQNYFWIGGGFTYDIQGQIWLQKYFHSIPQLIENFGNLHSSYLTLWLNTGFIGLALFLFGVGSLYYKANLKSHLISAALFSFLFLAIYESWMTASLNPFTWIFWTIPSLLLIKD